MTCTNFPAAAFIDGKWIEAGDGATFSVSDPATGEHLQDVADCGQEEVERAITASMVASQTWRQTSAFERAQILERWHDLMCKKADDLAHLITREMGKPLAEAKGEVLYGASYIKWFAEEATRAEGTTFPSPFAGARTVTVRAPVGLCAAITPWNFPNAMLMRKAAPALAAGCTMIAKPAEETPMSALAAADLAIQAGVPAGVFNVIPSSRPELIAGILTAREQVRKISFTGSTAVGRELLGRSAANIKRVSMELGGNAPFLVFEDADIDAAVEGAMLSKFRNAGQTCVCTNRILVHKSVHGEFRNKLADAIGSLRLGPGLSPDSDVGPLVNEAALFKTEALVSHALASGAELIVGGTRSDLGPNFYVPTLVDAVTPAMRLFAEEIFGPVASLCSFESEEEAFALANSTEYGLAAYCYTRSLGRAWRAAEHLEYGMVAINSGILSNAAAPFGGMKQSGLGKEGGRLGIDEYLETKFVLMGGLER